MQPALQLALLVAILLPIGKLAASLCTRVGIPGILGELLAGVVLGPGAINLLHLDLFKGGQATGGAPSALTSRRYCLDVHRRH